MTIDTGTRNELRQHIGAFAPTCPQCNRIMKAWMMVPGRLGNNLVVYRCQPCGSEATHTVPG